MRQGRWASVWRRIQGTQLVVDRVGDDVIRIRMRSRLATILGIEVSAYLVGRLLVDTGFAHIRHLVVGALSDHQIAAICCTHHHEDHTGNCGPLSAAHRCPVYLYHPECRKSEGAAHLRAYRRLWWGYPGPYRPTAMPELVSDETRTLVALPAPGHSVTHVALWEKATATVFTGDLFVAPGASAVMADENPFALAASLVKVASLRPRLMLTGHGLAVTDPAARMIEKARRVRESAARVLDLKAAGLGERSIVRRVFERGNAKDRMLEVLTGGEFSRLNFIRACVRHAATRDAPS